MKIPLFRINWENSDIKAVEKVIKSGQDWAIGKEVEELEKAISRYVGVKHGIAFSSGTSALHALMLAYGIQEGDEVIVPSFTFVSTANCILFVGATPVFADIELDSLGLDPEDVERKITDKTKAIIAVHYGGCPCKIKNLKKIAKKHQILLIEDACEALGAEVGKFGDATVFSFCQNKVVTSGEGGIVVTNDKNIAEKLRKLRNHGKEGNDIVSLGYNFRMPNLLAALALSQFRRIHKIIAKRRANAKYLTKLLFGKDADIKDNHTYQLYTIEIKERNHAKEKLERNGIHAKVYFEPIHLTKLYQSLGYREGQLPVTEQITKEVLTLPMYPDLTRKEMDAMAKLLWKTTSSGE